MPAFLDSGEEMAVGTEVRASKTLERTSHRPVASAPTHATQNASTYIYIYIYGHGGLCPHARWLPSRPPSPLPIPHRENPTTMTIRQKNLISHAVTLNMEEVVRSEGLAIRADG